MPFNPSIGEQLTLDGVTYRFVEHPSAKGLPYGQSGRRATVYQLEATGSYFALKVFRTAFQSTRLVRTSEQLRAYAKLPGLAACDQTVLAPGRYPAIVARHPDLRYAVMMPWIPGETWQELMLEGRGLLAAQSDRLAAKCVATLAALEERGVAHADLSGPNLLLRVVDGEIAFVDVDEMYAPDLPRPEKLPAGSPGYAHRTASAGLWRADADRFAGAVLLAELLAWRNEAVRRQACGEQYFAPDELQTDSARYVTLSTVLGNAIGPDVQRLFEQAWRSPTIGDCPPFAAWRRVLAGEPALVEARLQPAPAASQVSPSRIKYRPRFVPLGTVTAAGRPGELPVPEQADNPSPELSVPAASGTVEPGRDARLPHRQRRRPRSEPPEEVSAPVPAAADRQLGDQLERGRALLRQGDLEPALIVLAAEYRADPERAADAYAEALLARGWAFEAAKKLGFALIDYEQVLTLGASLVWSERAVERAAAIKTELLRAQGAAPGERVRCPGCDQRIDVPCAVCPACLRDLSRVDWAVAVPVDRPARIDSDLTSDDGMSASSCLIVVLLAVPLAVMLVLVAMALASAGR